MRRRFSARLVFGAALYLRFCHQSQSIEEPLGIPADEGFGVFSRTPEDVLQSRSRIYLLGLIPAYGLSARSHPIYERSAVVDTKFINVSSHCLLALSRMENPFALHWNLNRLR
ncbi:hypothetical protein BT96DRAFT_164709 [Gymnopus androsaceus JB14]|uniref:Secreted protein n=1 Tax=Gymnopus androsaceus JB14 TaxID=1447944 RepID=A0A6A4HBI0_9AGAR|nr:hypothetical protein BT96DRAFT_164709 [Gymnopus androsaceus JB14]